MFKPSLNSSQWSLAAMALCLAAITARAQFPLQWSVDTARAQEVTFDIYHGETIPLEPAYRIYGSHAALTNITSATFYWQTAGMGDSWWSKPAEVILSANPSKPDRIRATFHPTNDCAAAFYTFFIRADTSAGSSYRANGNLIMRSSPGFIPAILPAPSLYPTLANQIAPYVLDLLPPADPLGSALAVSNSLSTAWAEHFASITAEFNNISNYTAAAISTNRPDKLWSSSTNYTDAAGVQWEIVSTTLNAYKCVQSSSFFPEENLLNDIYYPYDITVGIVPELPMITSSNVLYRGISTSDDLHHIFHSANALEYGIPLTAWIFNGFTGSEDEMGKLYFYDSIDVNIIIKFDPYVYTFVTTNRVGSMATTNYVADVISAHTVNFTDCLLYTAAGTNYYFRWSEPANTYIVTGVPINE